MRNAIYVGKGTPDLVYGQVGTYYDKAEAFTPDFDLNGLYAVELQDMYFPWENRQQCNRGWRINPAWEKAQFDLEFADFTVLAAGYELEQMDLTIKCRESMMKNGFDNLDPIGSGVDNISQDGL